MASVYLIYFMSNFTPLDAGKNAVFLYIISLISQFLKMQIVENNNTLYNNRFIIRITLMLQNN